MSLLAGPADKLPTVAARLHCVAVRAVFALRWIVQQRTSRTRGRIFPISPISPRLPKPPILPFHRPTPYSANGADDIPGRRKRRDDQDRRHAPILPSGASILRQRARKPTTGHYGQQGAQIAHFAKYWRSAQTIRLFGAPILGITIFFGLFWFFFASPRIMTICTQGKERPTSCQPHMKHTPTSATISVGIVRTDGASLKNVPIAARDGRFRRIPIVADRRPCRSRYPIAVRA